MSYLDDLFINDVKHSGSPAGGGSGGSGDGVSSWNDLPDKPFYETESILSETQDSKQLKYIGYVVDGLHYYHNDSFLKIEFNDEYYIYEIDAANGIPSGAIELTGQLNSANTITFNVYVERFGTPNGRYVTVNSDVTPKTIQYCQRSIKTIEEKYIPYVYVHFKSDGSGYVSNKTLNAIHEELGDRSASLLRVVIGNDDGYANSGYVHYPIRVMITNSSLIVYWLQLSGTSGSDTHTVRLVESRLENAGTSVTTIDHMLLEPTT